MRGRTRAITRFNKFKEELIFRFPNASREASLGEAFSYFVNYLESSHNFDRTIKDFCDKDEYLRFDEDNLATVLYQIFRLADKPVLLRDLETLSDKMNRTRNFLYTALSVLVSVNLLNYKILGINGRLENNLQFFIKDE